MLAVIVGLVFAVIGLWGMVAWWPDFIIVVKGSVPALLLIGGILAIVAGATAIRDSLESRASTKKEIEGKKE